MVRFAIICASNQNRSMEAHNVLKNKGFDVHSYGTGSLVRLPGPAIDKPNIYPFGTPYDQVYQELKNKDPQLYTQNGLLSMLDRNRKIKPSPERFQETNEHFDVIITCEERCFDAVLDDLMNKGGEANIPVHIINVEIKDNHEDAALGGRAILQLAQKVERMQDVDNEIQEAIEKFSERYPGHPVLHAVTFY